MDIVKIQLGRAVWLFDTQELNPRGVSIYPDLIIGFCKRYQFATVPQLDEIQPGKSMYFKQGQFCHESTTINVDLELHGDGFVAETRHSTEAASSFLQDFMDWCQSTIGVVSSPRIVTKRIYRSELIVSLNANRDTLNEKFAQFAALVSEVTNAPSLVSGIQFGSQESPAAFLVERRVGSNILLKDNYYISNAWISTYQHIELLRRFEELMA